MTKIERSKLEIAEYEADLANFLGQRKQLDAEIAEAGAPSKRAQLVYARSVLSDEVEGAGLLLADARVALQQAQADLDALRAQQAIQPHLAARAAALTRAWHELIQSTDELLATCEQARAEGLRVAITGLAGGGGAVAPTRRIDLVPLRAVPLLTVDDSGAIRCEQTALDRVAGASETGDNAQGAA